ncbi:phage holin, lambda family [Rahnella sp. ChDrAdgB13]|uniref:phage holin, lambda family n=1 Tax=Rahnella sp. ChDrAdgB13 TaxID=1850581 RepID=UPI001AD88646|nr:phage holin, lambda family [Rahnella sp. ChDrAdgB13]
MQYSPSEFLAESVKWVADNAPIVYTAASAFSIAAIMSLRDGKRWIYSLMGGCVCAVIALSLGGVLDSIGFTKDVAPVIGPVIGFIGADKLRDIILAIVERRTGADGGNNQPK